ncbi:hypothetical protein HMPREF0208_03207 [Citrobacter koseri]|nr:hypothetical protein HMPREF0208_03207 [Citrobacter koseri]
MGKKSLSDCRMAATPYPAYTTTEQLCRPGKRQRHRAIDRNPADTITEQLCRPGKR